MTYFNNNEIFDSALYIVPTPIGNLGDITHRALFILREVDLIAVEDTRRTNVLLQHFSIDTPLFVFHEYNEKYKTSLLLSKLQLGYTIALVSDAGTPLISDPGYCLVRECYSLGIRVVPLPGACAAITALSASGLSTNRFCFEGFLPVKRLARIKYFKTLLKETRTVIFYDSKYRIINTLKDMLSILGPERRVVLARELTKIQESIYCAPLKELLQWVQGHRCIRGEIVVILEGISSFKNDELQPEIKQLIQLLVKELSLRCVINLMVKVYGLNRNVIYNYLLKENV